MRKKAVCNQNQVVLQAMWQFEMRGNFVVVHASCAWPGIKPFIVTWYVL